MALPQIPPGRTSWSSAGKRVYRAKGTYEKYLLHEVGATKTKPYREKLVLQMARVKRLEGS